MPTKEAVTSALLPICDAVARLDLSDPEGAERCLAESWPAASLTEIESLLKTAQSEGWLTPRRATPDLTFGRLAKATDATHGLSIDAVDMGGAGLAHTHPNGEVSLCFVQEGAPRFCGRPGPWVVVPPGSHHTPEVTGGRMLIVYFLPGGAMVFDQS